jgi:hypothetical protein
MFKGTRPLLILAGIAALALPAVAAGKPGHGNANGHGGQAHNVMYILKGTYGDGGIISVSRGNGHAKRAGLVGTDVTVDLSAARITVADTNADGTADVSDVVAGDQVLVQARLPKNDPGAQPFAARHLIDQTNPPVGDGEDQPDES